MGSGKSLIGSQLAASLGLKHLDSDKEIALNENKSINEIFRDHGELYFRKLESDFIKEYSTVHDIVISTGGGLPCANDNIALLKSSGTTIYLFCTLKLLTKRLWEGRDSRPLITNIETKRELKSFVLKKLMQREEYYYQSDFIVDSTKEENIVVKDIASIISRIKK